MSRSERFDELVLAAVDRIEARNPAAASLDVVVAEIPPIPADASEGFDIELGHVEAATRNTPARIVIHRRPIELRCDHGLELAALIADVVAEQVAAALGLTPRDVDPDYGI